jgi:putative phage-type endonuclease
MDYQSWLEKRRESIGGSDAGPIMGLSDYGSKLTVYCDKKSIGSRRPEGPAARRGKILEPVIRQLTQEEFPEMEIQTVPFMFYHPDRPFMSANIDGVISIPGVVKINGKDIHGVGGYEVKTSKTGYGFGDDEVPDTYFAQVQHYMAVIGLPWFILSVYILENEEIRHYAIFRNVEFIEDMIKQEKGFWENYVIPGLMPAAIGIETEEDMITGMFDGSETLVLEEPERHACAEYVSINNAIKDLEKKKLAVKVNLMETIVQMAKGTPQERKVSAIAGPYSVSWITVERRDVDREAMKKTGDYEKYLKVSTYDRFTVTEKKGT